MSESEWLYGLFAKKFTARRRSTRPLRQCDRQRHHHPKVAPRWHSTTSPPSANLLPGGGSHNGERILNVADCQRMLTNANTGLRRSTRNAYAAPATTASASFSTSPPWFMGVLAGPRSFDTPAAPVPDRDLAFALLTNRAHPNWSWAGPDPVQSPQPTSLPATSADRTPGDIDASGDRADRSSAGDEADPRT